MRNDNASGYIEEINENKYLVFDVRDENKKSVKRYDDLFNGITGKIRKLMIGLNMQKTKQKLNLIQMIIYH